MRPSRLLLAAALALSGCGGIDWEATGEAWRRSLCRESPGSCAEPGGL